MDVLQNPKKQQKTNIFSSDLWKKRGRFKKPLKNSEFKVKILEQFWDQTQ
jgi:hypothetical protein